MSSKFGQRWKYVEQKSVQEWLACMPSMLLWTLAPSNNSVKGSSLSAFSSETKFRLKAVFDYFDRDGTGKLELDELEELLNALGQCVTKEEVRVIMASEDIDSDGVMSLKEFVEFYKKHGKDAEKVGQEIGDAFKKFDKAGRGYLSKVDMETILTKGGAFPFTKEEADMCFDAFDLNKDGQMDYGEFANFLCTICPTFEDLEKLNDSCQ